MTSFKSLNDLVRDQEGTSCTDASLGKYLTDATPSFLLQAARKSPRRGLRGGTARQRGAPKILGAEFCQQPQKKNPGLDLLKEPGKRKTYSPNKITLSLKQSQAGK